MSEFENKVVLITGAAGALGRAVVDHFAAEGARVAQLDVLEISNDHYSANCDLLDPKSCQQAVDDIVGNLGAIDVLANIAGGFAMGEAVHETTEYRKAHLPF